MLKSCASIWSGISRKKLSKFNYIPFLVHLLSLDCRADVAIDISIVAFETVR